MTSKEVKDQVRDSVEHGIDKLHGIPDVLTSPIAPLDGAFHGAARGIPNFVTDKHPEDKVNNCPNRNHNNGSNCQPQPPQPQPGASNNFSGANVRSITLGKTSTANIHGNATNAYNNPGNDNGAIKFGNFGTRGL